jgi:hypothetical protein
MKVVELQRRGLPHFHAVVRLDAATEPGQPPCAPQTSLGAAEFVVLVREAAVDTELTIAGSRVIRFGEQVDTRLIGCGDGGASGAERIPGRRIARYLAKYVTKSVADFGVGVRPLSPGSIEQFDVTDHVRSILRTIVTLAQEDYRELASWLHTLGYRGHVVSKSRQFSTTMTALRERRAAWRKAQSEDPRSTTTQEASAMQLQWEFERLGHASLGDRVLVASAFCRAQEQRFAARNAAREAAAAKEGA